MVLVFSLLSFPLCHTDTHATEPRRDWTSCFLIESRSHIHSISLSRNLSANEGWDGVNGVMAAPNLLRERKRKREGERRRRVIWKPLNIRLFPAQDLICQSLAGFLCSSFSIVLKENRKDTSPFLQLMERRKRTKGAREEARILLFFLISFDPPWPVYMQTKKISQLVMLHGRCGCLLQGQQTCLRSALPLSISRFLSLSFCLACMVQVERERLRKRELKSGGWVLSVSGFYFYFSTCGSIVPLISCLA